MPAEALAQSLVCLECRHRVVVTPTISYLGFRAFVCPWCDAEVIYPLSARYRIGYRIGIPSMLLATVIGASIGSPILPGLLFLGMAFALIRDRTLVRAVRKASFAAELDELTPPDAPR